MVDIDQYKNCTSHVAFSLLKRIFFSNGSFNEIVSISSHEKNLSPANVSKNRVCLCTSVLNGTQTIVPLIYSSSGVVYKS